MATETIYQRRVLLYAPTARREALNRAINGTDVIDPDTGQLPPMGTENLTAEVATATNVTVGWAANWQMTQDEFDRLSATLAGFPTTRFAAFSDWDSKKAERPATLLPPGLKFKEGGPLATTRPGRPN